MRRRHHRFANPAVLTHKKHTANSKGYRSSRNRRLIFEHFEDRRVLAATSDEYFTFVNTPVSGNVLANDYVMGVPSGCVDQPSTGWVEIDCIYFDGGFTFYPAYGFSGSTGFSYNFSDYGEGGSAGVTVHVFESNTAPVGNDDEFETDEDTPLTR